VKALISIAALLLVCASPAEARRHHGCSRSQIYRVSLGTCEAKRHFAKAGKPTGSEARAARKAAREAARQARREARREARRQTREEPTNKRNPKLTYVKVVEPQASEDPPSVPPCGPETVPLALLPLYDLPSSTMLHPPVSLFDRRASRSSKGGL
jgi:hypothetical protein